MKHFNFSSLGSVYKHISVLKRKGVLSAEKNSARSMALSETSPSNGQIVDLPFLGQISAGNPIQTFPQAGSMTVPASLVNDSASSYVLQVRCNSMEDQILNGDLIVVEKKVNVISGATVIVCIDGHEVTLKKYFPKDESLIELHSLNSRCEVLKLPSNRLHVQGVLSGLIRSYSDA